LTALELVLSPDAAGRLPRLMLLSGLRAGRMRRRSVSIVWHDTADGALAQQGLALAETRGGWRLERLVPGTTFWAPGAPPPVIEQAASLDLVNHPLPTGLLQVARFDGTVAVLPLARDGVTMTIELAIGTIGWARRRRPACRMVLKCEAGAGKVEAGAAEAGEEAAGEAGSRKLSAAKGGLGGHAAVLELASALAEDVEIAIPAASLAAEARAAATAAVPAPRHEGPPRLPAGLTVAEAFSFVLGHLADVILHNAPLAAAGRDGPEPVHEMRVAVRRARSSIALFRPAVGCPAVDAATVGLKALADRLAPARDWDVFVAETAAAVAEVLPDDTSLRRLRAAAERRRRHAYAALRDWLRSSAFRRLGIALAGLAGDQAWMAALEPAQQETQILGLDAFASRALTRRLHRLATAGEEIEQLDPGALHAIRLRAKRLRYAAEVFAPIYPAKATRRFLRRLATMQDRLGRINDGTVANTLLADLGSAAGPRAHAVGLVRGFLAARGGNARGRVARAWKRFHRLEPFWS
jgi:CHAD domain-containing protein